MQPFGGASIILVGDLSQFLPISNIPMYASCSSTIALWYTFTISVTLDTIFCQQGDSPTQQEFWVIILHIRNGEVVHDHLE